MKKFLFCCCVFTALILASCNDDQGLENSSEVTEATEDQLNYSERTCNSTDHQHGLLQDALYRAKFEKRVEKTSQLAKTRSAVDCTEPIVLPMAVHFQNLTNPDEACLKALAQTQIEYGDSFFNFLINNEPNYKYSTLRIQSKISVSCGQFCIFFAHHRCAGYIYIYIYIYI